MAEEQVFIHHWLVSVINAEAPVDINGKTEWLMRIYLTGYCRNCGRGFSSPIPYTNEYIEAPMNVPLEGCFPPNPYL